MALADKPWQPLAALSVSGLLLSLPGGLLPLWGYHVRTDWGAAGNLFLLIGVGCVLGALAGQFLPRTLRFQTSLALGCFVGAAATGAIAFFGPSAPFLAQAGCLGVAGIGSGLVNFAVLDRIAPAYERSPAGTLLIGGSFLGGGSWVAAMLLSRALAAPSALPWLLSSVSLTAAAGFCFLSPRFSAISETDRPPPAKPELRQIFWFLFAILVFLQFGIEWGVAGWLPVFLVGRLGVSPGSAVSLLALYWLALTAGRVAAFYLLTRVKPSRLLTISTFGAVFGSVLLWAAANQFAVVIALLLTGVGYSAIFPLSAEHVRSRFVRFHRAYFNGIFSFAVLGGTITPWALGHLASGSTLQIVPLAALVLSCAVFLVILFIWLTSKVLGE